MNSTAKTITILVGVLAGAAIGYKAAVTLIAEAERDDKKLPVTATQGLQIGLSAMQMLKQISGISRSK
ncbi:MAG TPA: hypothetical protein PKK82_01795 [Anaerolineaceae bacterium]|nr:hypothetical protein [Chloroflexota bacterium]HNY83564.1 hypothetical protein [Anaerolineaceae bacterium]